MPWRGVEKIFNGTELQFFTTNRHLVGRRALVNAWCMSSSCDIIIAIFVVRVAVS